jgi:hypothetical protein
MSATPFLLTGGRSDAAPALSDPDIAAEDTYRSRIDFMLV